MRKGETYEFVIQGTEFPGYGVAYHNDKKVLIKATVPGQKLLARVVKKKSSKIEAKVVEILEDVDYAIKPSCPHFPICGGCTHQFITYEKQLEFKEKQVLSLLKDGGIENFKYNGITGSPEEFEYRNKMEFTFGDMEKDGELCLGMHMKGKSFSVFTSDKCEIVDEDFRNVTSIVVNYFKEKNVPYYRVIQHQGYLRNLVIRKGKNTEEILINLVTTSQLDFDLSELTSILTSTVYKGKLTSIIHTINDSLADMVQPDKVEILYGRDYIIEELLGLKFKITPFSFFQTNSKGAERLYSIVGDFIGELKDKTVFDLYCGTGTIGQITATHAKYVLGVELIEEAVQSAKENAAFNNITNCDFIAGDVGKVIKTVNIKPDIIILDPPRPGVHPDALKQVIDFNAKEIIYVSCNPKSLSVDLQELVRNGYEVKEVNVMDMFPQTPHVETVVRLSLI